MESTCTLCGVEISYSSPHKWLQEFRAIYCEKNQWEDVKVSGIGIADEAEVDPVCPEHQGQRYDDQGLDPDSTIFLHLGRASLDPQPINGIQPLDFSGFGFHSACWDILMIIFQPSPQRLFSLCQSMPVRIPDILDWGHDYGGAAIYSTLKRVPQITSCNLARAPAGASLQAHPVECPELRQAIDRLHRPVPSSMVLDSRPNTDVFNRLPPEILQFVLNYLPSNSVTNARLGSRTFASVTLSEGFWASRFQQGFEFQHILEASSHPPNSWRAFYTLLRDTGRLIPGIENRRRIWGLGLKIKTLYDQMGESSCHGSSIATLFEPNAPEDTGNWHLAKASLKDPSLEVFQYGCRPLRSRLVQSTAPLNAARISVSFIDMNNTRFISGITFVDENGDHLHLGYIHPEVEESINLPAKSSIQGWYFAIDLVGIKAIAVRTTDGKMSPWIGDKGSLPLWHLSTPLDVHTAKADFDTLKLVSFGFEMQSNPSKQILFRDSCLWAPRIPPATVHYNMLGYDTPPKHFDLPFTVGLFGGWNRPTPSTLIQIVAYTFDIDLLTGLEFQHTDSNHDFMLGKRGPFNDYPKNRCNTPPDDRRIPISIDGPGGERITDIQVEISCHDIQGLKIETSFGREHSIAPPSGAQEKWIRIQPSGSTVIGIFALSDWSIRDIGLLSINENDTVIGME